MSFTLQVLFFLSLPFILAILIPKSYFSSSKSVKNLPPSPPKLPLIGNLHQLGSSPHRALQAMAQTYGPLMLIQLGTVPVLVASSVDAAKEIMKTHDLIFSNRPHLNIPDRVFYACKDIAFSKYGEYWRQVKSIAVLHLLSNKRVQSYQHVRYDEMTLMMGKIRSANGSPFNLSELLITLTNNVVCRVALGRTYEGRKFKNLLERLMESLGGFSVGSYIPSLRWVDRLSGLERRADQVAKEFDEFLEDVLDEHVNKNMDNVEARDLVDILLEFRRDNAKGFRLERDMIKALIVDIFSAGTDTTFTSLEWATCEAIKTPSSNERIAKRSTRNRQRKITVFKEGLRLHTPLPLLVPRESTEDIKLNGYDIQSGTQVLINAWAIARDPSVWEEPEEFRPERFLNSPIDYKGFGFELIPFGAGRRGCPGIQFAMVVNELVLG
ncbi:putative cytochrome P450 [Helianthus annuus]|nr:putative cytochrome P450 [Helianthus annuus]